jgi:hypothetical protein
MGSLTNLCYGFKVFIVLVLEVLEDDVLFLEVGQPSGQIGLFGLIVMLVNHKSEKLDGEYKVGKSELIKYDVVLVSNKGVVLVEEGFKGALCISNDVLWDRWSISPVVRLNYLSVVQGKVDSSDVVHVGQVHVN